MMQDALSSVQKNRETMYRTSVVANGLIDPARQAKAIQVGQRLGIPADVAYRNLDKLAKSGDSVPLSVDVMPTHTPTLLGMIHDPIYGPLAQNGVTTLQTTEEVFGSLGVLTPKESAARERCRFQRTAGSGQGS